MLTLICNIKIFNQKQAKQVSVNYVNDIKINSSIRNLTDTAVVSLPVRIFYKDKPILDFIDKGNEIEIKLGYSQYGLELVFAGYITKIVKSEVLELQCENEMYRLKFVTVKPEIFKKFNFKTFFKQYLNDIEIEQTGDIDFGSMDIKTEMTMAQALDEIMKIYTFLNCYFIGKKLVVAMLTTPFAEKEPKFLKIGTNTISDTLEYTAKEDVKISIKATSILKDNSKLEVIVPTEAKDGKGDYEQRHFYAPECTTQEELKKFAEKKLEEYKVDKITGNVTIFGIPFIEKTDNVIIYDNEREEIDNKNFFVDAVNYKFGVNGYRQEITLGNQLKY
jgi:hypothetical protein